MTAVTGSKGTATVTVVSDTAMNITREFNAPARLVWQVLTTPELVSRWWVGERGRMTSCEIDLRVGGTWRYVMLAEGDFEVGFHGEYREIVPHERIVSTETYEGFPDAYSVNTVTLVEADGRTTLNTHVQHQEPAHLQGHLDSGMEGGMQEAYDRLEEIALSLG